MFRRSLIAIPYIVISISVASPGRAQGVTLEGMVDCGNWVAARTVQRATALEHYLLGLLNGTVMGSGIEFWWARDSRVSREQVFLWMDNYCQRTPLSDLIVGAQDLVNERTGNAWDRHWGRS
jgi:hypothetical protein